MNHSLNQLLHEYGYLNGIIITKGKENNSTDIRIHAITYTYQLDTILIIVLG